MLLNNLDPRGRGAARGAGRLRRLRAGGSQPRSAPRARRLVAHARRGRDPARPERQAGRRLPHAPRSPSRADRELAARAALGDLARSSGGSKRSGLTMFGQMTAGSWIYIGTQGILQGTYQTFAAAGERALRLGGSLGAHDPHGRTRRDGRCPAARGDHGGRGDSLRRGRSRRGSSGGWRRGTSTRRRTRSTTRLSGSTRRHPNGGRSRSGCSATPPRSCPSWCGAGPRVRPRHRPNRGARSADRLRPGRDYRSARPTSCGQPTPTSTCAGLERRSHGMSRHCSSTSGQEAMFSIMATTCEVRPLRRA